MKDNKITCSGALIYSLETHRFLFLHRTHGKHKNQWGLVGGTNESEETPWEGLKREITEEIGIIEIKKSFPLETFISNDSGFFYHTYFCLVEKEFIPMLNDEHDGYSWVSFQKWPKPLHQGLRNTLQNKVILNKLDTVIKLLHLLN